MRILHLVPGSGGTFYCENCMRDASLVRTLRRLGHDVIMVPLYLPLFVDSDEAPEDAPVFFGGINVYLQQVLPFFRKTPRWLDRFFDRPWMLKRAAAREGSTHAAGLGAMTLSMLRGASGNQRKELARLVAWLGETGKPDVVHLSNALLLGLAGEIKAALDVPLVCSLQDEDTWLDAMAEADAGPCWAAMAEAAREVDAFVAVSQWYADQMRVRMELGEARMDVIHLGIEMPPDGPARTPPNKPVLGYLSRLTECHGLGQLVDAFIGLKGVPGLEDLQLRATGGVTPIDQRFVRSLEAKLDTLGFGDAVEFVEDFQRESRHAFLQSLSVLSVPVPKGEAFGTFILEALAHGVPVVQPRAGGFPEVIEATGGGLLYDPETAGGDEAALSELLLDPERAQALGSQGSEAVRQHFSIEVMAEKLVAFYSSLSESAAS